MSLPAPHLDDWKFQAIVDETKRRIGLRCPEWTDHNVSDPGVTLIEQFAWMTELLMYRMNLVPERNYVKYLEMLGVGLEPPMPAQTELRFRLAWPIEDSDEEEEREIVLPAREIVAATVRTEFEEAVEFATDASLTLVRPRLTQVVAVPAAPGDQNNALGERELSSSLPPDARWFLHDGKKENSEADANFGVFSERPRQGDCLWLGFDGEVNGNVVEVVFQCLRAAGTGLDEENPAQVWETWNSAQAQWEPLELARPDTTRGFNQSGSVEMALSWGMEPLRIGGRRAFWVRCRYTLKPEDLPSFRARRDAALAVAQGGGTRTQPSTKSALTEDDGSGGEWLSVDRIQEIEEEIVAATAPIDYESSPRILSVYARTQGGTAPATNCITIFREELGISDGLPGQTFRLRGAPVLPRTKTETALIGSSDASSDELETWTEVADFAESTATDRHFTLDSSTGELRFGPTIGQPDGSVRQHGRVPETGKTIFFSAYRTGGGIQGNVAERQVRVLKTAVPYISEVENPRRAIGGLDGETLEHAKMRAQSSLRIRERAVTAEDFEYLARRASTGVGRALCLPPDETSLGVVRLFLIPALSNTPVPLPSQLRVPPRVMGEVKRYLDERRLLTTVVRPLEPEYVFVSTDIILETVAEAEPAVTRRRVQDRLAAFLHPLTGGPRGDGWPFGRTLRVADLYAQIQEALGMALLHSLRVYRAQLVNPAQGIFGPEQEVTLETGIELLPHQTLCTRSHRIQVRSSSRSAI